MPGVTSAMPGPTILRRFAASSAEHTSPSTPVSRACAARAARQLADAELVAGGEQIGVVIGREHGDGENVQASNRALPSTAAFMVCG